MLERTSPVPLWVQLRNDLLARLDARDIAGEFPGELALATEYGVSRNTVRQAVRHLRDAGLVLASPGHRTKVAKGEVEQLVGTLSSLFESVERSGMVQQSEVRDIGMRTCPPIAAKLAREGSSHLFYLERLRMADGDPLALDRLWMPEEIGASLVDADFSHTSVYRELASRAGRRITSGREEIRAVVPDAPMMAALEIGPEVAVLHIERLGCSDGVPIEYRETYVRGDRFRARADFSARHGYHFFIGSSPARAR